ncbi:inward rectifier potassium channel 16-like [Neosynchiropus ocellatus]
MSPEQTGHEAINTSYTTVHAFGGARSKKQLCYMQKDGRFPVVFQKGPGDWSPFFMDIFTTLVEIRWTVMILFFCLSYILSWLLFGLCYWLIAYVNGDTASETSHPCVENVRSFTAAFLYSMETQATIGYGFRGMTENCMVAIVVVTIQDVFSCLLDTIIIGVIVAKMASARKRAQTVGFSSFAVVNLRDRILCLSFRLADFRGNHILEGVAKAQLVRHVRKPSGYMVMQYQDLELEEREVVLPTPVTIIHRINPDSPLYRVGPEDLLEDHFEIIVTFTYTGDSTGLLHQTRTCYTPADLRWGQRFQDMLKQGKSHYRVDYSRFNESTWVPVPHLSAEQYDRAGNRDVGRAHASQLSLVKRDSATVRPYVTEEVLHQTIL